MIVCSIDIMDGQAVQLIGGQERAIDAGDPRVLAERFSRVGPIAVIDLDAALGRGDNAAVIAELCRDFRCIVGGGIRSVERAKTWLDAGAEQVIIGTAASPEFFEALPRERCIAALDTRFDRVVVEGWTSETTDTVEARMEVLNPYVSGYLVTFVEREGRMGGTRLERVPSLVSAANGRRVTIAGGVTTAAEVAALDALGADAQVGMALYTGRLDLAEAFTAPMTSDRPDGLWPVVVTDIYDRALGLAYTNLEAIRASLEGGSGVYWSRRRGLWEKGASSGNVQRLVEIRVDCDRDALRYIVRQAGEGFCHLQTTSCWGGLSGLPELDATIQSRRVSAPAGSYTRRLFDSPELVRAKLLEEVHELLQSETAEDAAWEAADVLYFALVAAAARGANFEGVMQQLQRRAKAVSRRGGDPKPEFTEAA